MQRTGQQTRIEDHFNVLQDLGTGNGPQWRTYILEWGMGLGSPVVSSAFLERGTGYHAEDYLQAVQRMRETFIEVHFWKRVEPN